MEYDDTMAYLKAHIAGQSAATGSTIYASMDSHGIYKSSDFGTTWTSAGTALQGKTFYSLLADGNDIYAGW